MLLKKWLEATDYRIIEGSDYYWDCYDNAYTMSFWDDPDKFSTNVTYNRKTQEIYDIETYDYDRNNFYQWFNPKYRASYMTAAKNRGVDPHDAFDGERFIELETEEDILTKTTAIVSGKSYDDRILIPLTLDDDVLMILFKQAHEKDITFNQHIIDILQLQMELMKIADKSEKSGTSDWEFS